MFILEDLQGHIANLGAADVAQLVSFTKRSRHRNISMIYVMHAFSYSSNSVKSTFDRVFLGNTFV